MDIISVLENLLIDNKSYSLKVVEEIDFGFARNACLEYEGT